MVLFEKTHLNLDPAYVLRLQVTSYFTSLSQYSHLWNGHNNLMWIK